MNNLERNIIYQGETRLVGGVVTKRDADFGILFERNHYLDIARKFLSIKPDDIDDYEGWDRKVLHYQLSSGAIVAMTAVQGAAFAASGVERFIRAGASHIVRIGSCGSLCQEISPWDIIVNDSAFIDESTSLKYIEKKRGFYKSILDELICPTGFLNHIYEKLPVLMKYLIRNLNKKPYNHFIVFSDRNMDAMLMKEINSFLMSDSITQLHQVMNYTISARYLENKGIISRLKKDVPIKTIDMETSSILSCSAFHGIPSSIINIAIDSPTKESHESEKNSLKSAYYGIPNHRLYSEIIPRRIELCTQAVLNVFEKISQKNNYPLLITHQKTEKEI